MAAKGRLKGHDIITKDGITWVYEDNGINIEEEERSCKHCGKTCKVLDDCLGKLPGVKNACCGHGDREQSYIQFENGTIIRGFYI